MSLHRLLLLTTALASAPALAAAQASPAPPALGDLVVTASRLESSAQSSPYAIAVVPASELALRPTLADALRGLADVHVQAPGGRSSVSSLFLRGADPNFTLVMLDGVPLNAPTNSRGGSVNVSEIDTAPLERVEVVAGPLSSLYGSGALAGAINLVVPGGTDGHQLLTSIGAGTREDYSGDMQWRGPLGPGYGGSLAVTAADDGDMIAGSSFKTWSLTGKVAPLADPQMGRLLFRFAETDAKAFPDSSGGPRLAVLRGVESRDSREALVGLNKTLFSNGGFSVDVAGSYLSRRDTVDSPGVAPSRFDPFGIPAGSDATHYERILGSAVGRLDAGAWTALGGVEAQQEDGTSAGFLKFFGASIPSGFQLKRTTVSGFAEAEHRTGQLTVNGGVRADDVDGLGTHVTGRVGVRYRIADTGLSLRAAAGTGFKAPSFYALGNPFVGNPLLKPERSRSGELGLAWNGADGDQATLTLFHTRYSDLIDFVPGPPPHLENRSRVISRGVAAGFAKALGADLRATAQVQYATTEAADTGDQLLNRPRWRATAGLDWQAASQLTLSARYAYVGARDDYATPTAVATLPRYHSMGLDAAWRFNAATSVTVSVDNLFDSHHEEAIGFPVAPLRARVRLSHRL